MTKILFVCLGNICRSPTAEAVFKHKAKSAGVKVSVDSAGTIAAHQGHPPDSRSSQHGRKRGYSFAGQYARKVRQSDFHEFDFIYAMDNSNYEDLMSICPQQYADKVDLFLNLIELADPQVPDPYYGGHDGFEQVLDLVEQASEALLERLKTQR